MSVDPAPRDRLPQVLVQLKGLRKRFTPQRLRILEIMISTGEHLDVEQIRRRVSARGTPVSAATVYRTMRMLADEGIVKERHFGTGMACYEYVAQGEHHDHLICTLCGKVTEFRNDAIEAAQRKIAGRHGFTVTGHKHEIYGLCRDCRRAGKAERGSSTARRAKRS
jgi:Fur family ferric uptake transcriptional regulator